MITEGDGMPVAAKKAAKKAVTRKVNREGQRLISAKLLPKNLA
jgi:hypothetical protein